MNTQLGGAVAISVAAAGRCVGKVRSAWWLAALAVVGIGTLLGATPALAQDATWLAAPTVAGPVTGSFDFDNNANWATAGGTTPTPVPGSMTQTGTATFGMSNGTSISFSNTVNTLGGFTFSVGASNYTFSNSGLLHFNGAGIIVNGGSASFTNSSGGSIQFANGSTAGSATFNNNGGDTLFINASTAGSATFTNSGGGAVQFGVQGGTDTASAGTATITNDSGSTTFFLANTTAGSATIANNGGTIVFGIGTDTATAGAAAITNSNGGSTVFNASTTAGGATIMNSNIGGTSFFDTASAGSAAITNNNDGVTHFNANSMAGSAKITNNSGGLTQFGQVGGTDMASATNATITNNSGGITEFFAQTTAGSAAITNSGGSTIFNNTSTAGSATITNSNGITAFADTSTAGSAAITNNNGGATQFMNTSTAGNATITNSNGGQTLFLDASSAGSAHITTNSGGVAFFLDASTAGGATITNNGGDTLFGSASTAGSANIANNGGFISFNQTSTAGNATITNSGTVAFFNNSDGGSANLTNNAGGTIDFSGSTGPNGDGRLNVGSLAGSGTFIVGQQQIVNVSGSLAFTSGALYLVQVSGPNAGQLAVGGTAALAGQVAVDPLSVITHQTTYTILSSANPLSGTFSSVNLENHFARDPVLSIVGNSVLLTLQPGLLSPLLPANASANQVKVAGAIDNALLAGNNPSNAFSSIFNASGNALLNGVTQLSGETATGSQQATFDAMSQFMGVMTDPFMNRGGGFNVAPGASGFAEEDTQPSAYAAKSNPTDAFAFVKAPLAKTYDPRWSVWASGFGGSQSTSGNTALGSNNTTSSIGGTAVGADYLFSPNTIAGFALAGGGTNFSVANGGTGRSDLFQMGAYVRHTQGPAYVSASLAYGWQDITTTRDVTVAGFDQLRAQFNANAWSGRLEGGYRFVQPWIGGIGITPYAAAQFVTFDLPAYAEQAITGLNTFALSYGANDVTDARTELGIRTDKSWV
jgi:uncharacterized protein with beta-barrel porin domain